MFSVLNERGQLARGIQKIIEEKPPTFEMGPTKKTRTTNNTPHSYEEVKKEIEILESEVRSKSRWPDEEISSSKIFRTASKKNYVSDTLFQMAPKKTRGKMPFLFRCNKLHP